MHACVQAASPLPNGCAKTRNSARASDIKYGCSERSSAEGQRQLGVSLQRVVKHQR